MKKNIIIYYNRISNQLWFRPAIFCLFSVVAALAAHQADNLNINDLVPSIKKESVQSLLGTISSSMLVISTFAVGSMLSAFSSASSTATPRAFKIVVTDDVSKNALSVFIGAFIFSIVATVALDNGYYAKAGIFVLFVLTLVLFAIVILTFLTWVDRISRLGRLGHIISQVENTAAKALKEYTKHTTLKGNPLSTETDYINQIKSNSIGYLQNINVGVLQEIAEEIDLKIRVNCIPGKFIQENTSLVYFKSEQEIDLDELSKKINEAFHIGSNRLFDEDPRFGIIALTEIASRALSPGINDPGTAIQIIGSHERLFNLWAKPIEKEEIEYDRVEVPEIPIKDLFEDAFRPIARDGAGNIEVMLRLQKAFKSISELKNTELNKEAKHFSKTAFKRAKNALSSKSDVNTLKEVLKQV